MRRLLWILLAILTVVMIVLVAQQDGTIAGLSQSDVASLVPDDSIQAHGTDPMTGARPVVIEKVRHGKFFNVGGNMPLFSLEAMSDAQLGDVLAYLEMFGYEEFEEIEGLPLLDMVADSDADKFKHLLRNAAARTQETVCAAIGNLLQTYTAEECANYFRNSGYERT